MSGSQGSVVLPLRHSSPSVGTTTAGAVVACLPRVLNDTDSGGGCDDDLLTCLACRSVSSIRTDWSQGDRVCTACGVVHTEHLLDAGPEWRDYGDNDDSGNAGNKARSGLVITDERKYVGGLQPTLISRHIFGRSAAGISSNPHHSDIAQRLSKVNRRMDKLMERRHKAAFQNAAVHLKLLRRRRQQHAAVEDTTTDTDTVNTDTVATVDDDVEPDYGSSVVWMEERPEFEQQLLEQEHQVAVQRQALYADKWSLDRAKLLYGENVGTATVVEEELERLDETLRTAARDLYTCYQMLSAASTTLQLPVSITDEAAALLSQYAARRDGLKVKGVASNGVNSSLQPFKSPTRTNVTSRKSEGGAMGRTGHLVKNGSIAAANKMVKDEQQQQLRDANKLRQMGALCAALLFWTTRNRQRPRSLVAVCDSISLLDAAVTEKVQRKHCSRAMNELKEYFPELARVSTSSVAMLVASSRQEQQLPASLFPVPHAISVKTENGVVGKSSGKAYASTATASVANFTEHALSKLNLPPVAEASIRYLVIYYIGRHNNRLDDRSTALPTVCAAVTYFVCRAGSTMQQLASQAQADSTRPAKKRSSTAWSSSSSSSLMTKRVKTVCQAASKEASFDIFADHMDATDPPSSATTVLVEQRAYEMRRMWDAWMEQLPWSRTLVLVEQSTAVSKNVIWEYYKQHLFPDRSKLLGVLRDALIGESRSGIETGDNEALQVVSLVQERAYLSGTALASVLLPHVAVAAPLMKADSMI